MRTAFRQRTRALAKGFQQNFKSGDIMVDRKIAIVGAGPTGLVCLKEALALGLVPTAFEARSGIGGLWRKDDGLVWSSLHTNLSKWTCAFSDQPWPSQVQDFPSAGELRTYLSSYAERFGLEPFMRPGTRVTSVTPSDGGWRVTSLANGHSDTEWFDNIVICSGVFGTPYIPPLQNVTTFRGEVHHSTVYRNADPYQGKRVTVVGASFSGIEVACDLAAAGISVDLVFRKFSWIMPRLIQGETGHVPLDLLFYQRPPKLKQKVSNGEANLNRAKYFESEFGNPGRLHPALMMPVDTSPPMAAISDDFGTHIKSGAIRPKRASITGYTASGLVLDDQTTHVADAVIFCTGYGCDLSFLEPAVRQAIAYNPADRFVPFVADRTVFHPDLPGLAFAGVYRGPYFGVMELQARWATMVFADVIAPPTREQSAVNIEIERQIRSEVPQPQFPHGNYVEFADSIASEIGALPADDTTPTEIADAFARGPSLPSHYRLTGPSADPQLALETIRSAWARIGMQ